MGAIMVTLTPSLPKLPKLKFISKIKSSYEVASNLETVYVFDWEYENIFTAQLERKILFNYFDKSCRYLPATDNSKLIASLFGALGTATLGYVLGYFLGNLITSVLFSFLFVWFGLPIGYFLVAPLIARKPIWIVSKTEGSLKGIVHSRIGNTDIDPKSVTPEILYNVMMAKDATEIFRSGLSNFQKLAVGSLVVLAVSCLIALFLFVGAFGSGG